QEHPEEIMSANEFAELGAKREEGKLFYLFLSKGTPNAYIMDIPLMDYYEGKGKNKKGYELIPADWVDQVYQEPEIKDIGLVWKEKEELKEFIVDSTIL